MKGSTPNRNEKLFGTKGNLGLEKIQGSGPYSIRDRDC